MLLTSNSNKLKGIEIHNYLFEVDCFKLACSYDNFI